MKPDSDEDAATGDTPFRDRQSIPSPPGKGAWGEGEPAWWLNLQAQPEVTVVVPDGRRKVRGRAAEGEERERLWDRWREIDKDLDEFAARRSQETAVVVLEPLVE